MMVVVMMIVMMMMMRSLLWVRSRGVESPSLRELSGLVGDWTCRADRTYCTRCCGRSRRVERSRGVGSRSLHRAAGSVGDWTYVVPIAAVGRFVASGGCYTSPSDAERRTL